PLAGHRLTHRHIDVIHIGALLPVHLDRHKIPVEHPGHLFIFKGLPLHHVTPVAGGIADGQEDRLFLPLRLFKGLFAPGIPVHRIVGMLQKIRGFFMDQAVGFFHECSLPICHGFGLSYHKRKGSLNTAWFFPISLQNPIRSPCPCSPTQKFNAKKKRKRGRWTSLKFCPIPLPCLHFKRLRPVCSASETPAPHPCPLCRRG